MSRRVTGATVCRCECGAANCSGWLGDSSKPAQASMDYDDSESASDGSLYEEDGDGGYIKVAQLEARDKPAVRLPSSMKHLSWCLHETSTCLCSLVV